MRNTLLVFLFITTFQLTHAQTASSLKAKCESYFGNGYIYQGQENKIQFQNSNKVISKCTFFSGINYKIAMATDLKNGNLVFSILDSKKNVLFCNREYGYVQYWNFKFDKTLDCSIEITAEYPNYKNGIAYMMIGFKK
jgi:hypothetical protein